MREGCHAITISTYDWPFSTGKGCATALSMSRTVNCHDNATMKFFRVMAKAEWAMRTLLTAANQSLTAAPNLPGVTGQWLLSVLRLQGSTRPRPVTLPTCVTAAPRSDFQCLTR